MENSREPDPPVSPGTPTGPHPAGPAPVRRPSSRPPAGASAAPEHLADGPAADAPSPIDGPTVPLPAVTGPPARPAAGPGSTPADLDGPTVTIPPVVGGRTQPGTGLGPAATTTGSPATSGTDGPTLTIPPVTGSVWTTRSVRAARGIPPADRSITSTTPPMSGPAWAAPVRPPAGPAGRPARSGTTPGTDGPTLTIPPVTSRRTPPIGGRSGPPLSAPTAPGPARTGPPARPPSDTAHRPRAASSAPPRTGRGATPSRAAGPPAGRPSPGPSAAPAASGTTGRRPAGPSTGTGGPARVRAAATARRRTTLVGLGAVAAVAAAALVVGLLRWTADRPDPARALTVAESERLAAVRVTNYRDGRAGLRATIGRDGSRTELVGWVDWARPLVYLDVGGPGAGPQRGLVQALPGLVALRPDPAAVPTPAPPPVIPPADGWRIRTLPAGAPLARFLDLVFRLAADRPDDAAALRTGGARWISRSTTGAEPVDVLRAPGGLRPAPATGSAAPPTAAAAPSAADPDAPRYWVDRDARLHRLETRLPGAVPVTLTLDRVNRPVLRRIDALGGRPGLPRDLTAAEKARLLRVPARVRAAGGAALTLAVPTAAGGNLRGGGWIDWARQVAYVSTADLDTPGRRTLLRRDARTLLRADAPGAAEPGAAPPLRPPAGLRWAAGRPGGDEVAVLLDAALRAARTPVEAAGASWLRQDSVRGREVDVVESRSTAGRLRYWTDPAGQLLRLELHTRTGAYAQLDLVPGRTPPLPAGTPRR